MSPLKQQIAIAEASGLKNAREKWSESRGRIIVVGDYTTPSGITYEAVAPDYDEDLNAIQAAIRAQPEDVQLKIATSISTIVDPQVVYAEDNLLRRVMLATPIQWCKALLLALGKWEETK